MLPNGASQVALWSLFWATLSTLFDPKRVTKICHPFFVGSGTDFRATLNVLGCRGVTKVT